MDGKSLRKPHLVTPNPRGSLIWKHRRDGGRGERSVGRKSKESVGTATPQKGSQEPKEGYRSLSTWFPHGSVELVYIEASPRLRRETSFPQRNSPQEFPSLPLRVSTL